MTAATISTVVRVAELVDTCSSRTDHDITTELVRLSAALLRRDVAQHMASSRSADDRAGSAGGMRRIPGGWIVWHGDTSTYTKPLKGLVYLEHLIRRDGRAEHALDLVALTEGAAPADGPSRHQIGTDLGPVLDREARSRYEAHLLTLAELLDTAKRAGQHAKAEQLHREITFVARELAAATGMRGRDRVMGSAAEKARLNVTRAIGTAIDHVGADLPDLAEHLHRCVQKGTFCVYRNDGQLAWD